MPCIRILTNLPMTEIPKDFLNKLIPVLANTLKKDPKLFTCVIAPDCQVSFAGDIDSPAAVASMESIGHVELEDNKVTAKEVSAFVHKELGIHPDRFFLSFYDIKGANISKGGQTLA